MYVNRCARLTHPLSNVSLDKQYYFTINFFLAATPLPFKVTI